jgi:hypothetical protein
MVPELTTFLNTSTYNEVLVDRLTDLWDCREQKTTEITIGRGRESTAEVYVNMFAGTTPESLRGSLPEKAFGGGFVSRLCLVFVPDPTRCVPTPYVPDGYPRVPELVERLYWCAKNAKNWGVSGEFTLSPEANAEYIRFYKMMHAEILRNQYSQQHAQNRLTQLVLKVAMLIRMARYEAGTEISLDELLLAKRMMLFTIGQSKYATDTVGDTSYGRIINLVKARLARDGEVLRKDLLKHITSRSFNSADMDNVVSQLKYCGFLTINNNPHAVVTAVGGDRYIITAEGKAEMNIVEGSQDEITDVAKGK